MLFMKGSKSEPKCKFSTAIVNLLKEIGAEFSTFDILQDQIVREKLKTYSNWPTYPQVNLLIFHKNYLKFYQTICLRSFMSTVS